MKKLFLGQIGRWFGEELRPATAMRDVATEHLSLEATRRELALFASDMIGAQTCVGQFEPRRAPAIERRRFRDLLEETPLPYMVIDPRPGLHVVDVNEAYAAATLTTRARAAGGKLFAVFPDNPDDPSADGVSNLFESLKRAAQSGEPHTMMVQRYDVRDERGEFVERYWRPVNTPVFDDSGELLYLLNYPGALPPDFRPDKGRRLAFPEIESA